MIEEDESEAKELAERYRVILGLRSWPEHFMGAPTCQCRLDAVTRTRIYLETGVISVAEAVRTSDSWCRGCEGSGRRGFGRTTSGVLLAICKAELWQLPLYVYGIDHNHLRSVADELIHKLDVAVTVYERRWPPWQPGLTVDTLSGVSRVPRGRSRVLKYQQDLRMSLADGVYYHDHHSTDER